MARWEYCTLSQYLDRAGNPCGAGRMRLGLSPTAGRAVVLPSDLRSHAMALEAGGWRLVGASRVLARGRRGRGCAEQIVLTFRRSRSSKAEAPPA